jgi:hypothetical protein
MGKLLPARAISARMVDESFYLLAAIRLCKETDLSLIPNSRAMGQASR